MRILVAEDDSITRHIITSTLKKAGDEPIEATDGEAALRILSSRDGPDMAILDWMMPKMTGLEVLKNVRREMPDRLHYVLFLTSRSQSQDILATLHEGANDFIPKPLNVTLLQSRLQKGKRYIDMHKKLLQGPKLDTLSQLAAGLMQEMNPPLAALDQTIRELQGAVNQTWDHLAKTEAPWTAPCRTAVKPSFDTWKKQLQHAASDTKTLLRQLHAVEDFRFSGSRSDVPIDINACVEDALVITHFHLKAVAEVTPVLADNLPWISGHPSKLTQALMNLLVNAADAVFKKFKEQKGIIRVKTELVGSDIRIRIDDNGCGISPENQDKIFDPFFSTKPIEKSTGKGLALVQHFIRDHFHGKVTFESTPGQGTVFTLFLPLTRPTN